LLPDVANIAATRQIPNNNRAIQIGGTVIEIAESMSTFRDMATTDPNVERLAAELTRIYERAQEETLALLQSRPTEQLTTPVREWMNATQLAEYWQLYNDKNEPTTTGILKWSKRPHDQFPLPHAYMGDLLRFNRVEVDLWAHEEAERRRVQNEKVAPKDRLIAEPKNSSSGDSESLRN